MADRELQDHVDVSGAKDVAADANAFDAAEDLDVASEEIYNGSLGADDIKEVESDVERRRRSAEQTLARIAELKMKRAGAEQAVGSASVAEADIDESVSDPECEPNMASEVSTSGVTCDTEADASVLLTSVHESPVYDSESSFVETEDVQQDADLEGESDNSTDTVGEESEEDIGFDPVHPQECNTPVDIPVISAEYKEEPLECNGTHFVAEEQEVHPMPQASSLPESNVAAAAKQRVFAKQSAIGATRSLKKRNDEVGIKDIINLFIPKIWLIALCAVVFSVLLGGYALLFKGDTYTSRATFIVSTTSGGVTEGDIALSYKVIDIIETQVFTDNFLRAVADTYNERHKAEGDAVTAQQLKSSVTLSNLNDETPIFNLSVKTGDAVRSRNIAEVFKEYLVSETEGEDALISDFMHASYGRVTMTCIDSPDLGVANDKGVLTNALIGFLAGAVISMVAVYMVAMFDVVIHDRKKLEDHFDLPILGVIPRYDVPANEATKGGTNR